MTTDTNTTRDIKLTTFKQTSSNYPAFSEAALRWLRFNGDENGFNRCVVKIGRRVLIDRESFEKWIMEHKEMGALDE